LRDVFGPGPACQAACGSCDSVRRRPWGCRDSPTGEAPADHDGTCRRFDGVAGVWCVTSQPASVAKAQSPTDIARDRDGDQQDSMSCPELKPDLDAEKT
jgi:hypothetical protein